MTESEIRELLIFVHRENQSSTELKESLNKLLNMRSRFYLDHSWSERIDAIIYNVQLRLKMKLDEDSKSLPNLIKIGLVTETLKFMVPFILGIAVAVYGLPNLPQKNTENNALQTQQPNPSEP